MGYHTYVIDGDKVRSGLNKDVGFSNEDRKENIRRVAEVEKIFIDAGIVAIVALISPFKDNRQKTKEIIGQDNFIEVIIDTPIEECIKRDPKGLYKKALNGEIKNFTGIDSPYEKPNKPDVYIATINLSIKQSVDKIIFFLKKGGNYYEQYACNRSSKEWLFFTYSYFR